MPEWVQIDPLSWILIGVIAWFVRGKWERFEDHMRDTDAHWTSHERQLLTSTMQLIQEDIRRRNGHDLHS